jgi:GTP-binding protein
MQPLFEAIINNVPAQRVEVDGPLQLQVSSLDYNSYVGLMGIGRINRGVVKRNMPVTVVQRDGTERNAQLMELYGFDGLTRISVPEAGAGDIVVFSGIEGLQISDTVCARGFGDGLPPLQVDEPTITMTFQVNKSPFAGQEGKYLTSRQIRARLDQELQTTSRASKKPTTRTSFACRAAASCTCRCSSKTCGAKATSSRCRGRRSSSASSTAWSKSRGSSSRSTSRSNSKAQ